MPRTKTKPTTELIPLVPEVAPGALPVHQHKHAAAPIMPAPMMRAQKMGMMMGTLMTRSLNNQAASATVLPTQMDADTLREVSMIQQAIVKRVQQQQQDWMAGCQGIMQEYSQLKLANTMSKFVEQEYNILAQFGALVSSQTASWVGLMENIQVDYAYWISQKQPGVAQ
jgi:hypothetical protein